jgi:hypothetical protein
MSVRRFDQGELRKPERLPNGWLRAEGYLTRTGVFDYRQPDGTVRKELRVADEVFHADALASFGLVPITDDHPSVPLDATNTAQLARGAVGEVVQRDGDFIRAAMLVTDGALVEKLLSGEKQEVSCGYLCDLELSAGVTPDGERYDAIQRRIRGNHVAIVAHGRAGSDVRVRLDAGDAVQVARVPQNEERQGGTVVKVRIDGIEAEVSEQAAQLLARKDEQHAALLATERQAAADAKADAERARARADAAEAALAKAEKARADAADPSRVREIVKARVALESAAREVLGGDSRLDELDDLALRRAVVAKLSPEAKLDGVSEVYVQARYDFAVEQLSRRSPTADARRAVFTNDAHADAANDFRAARERFKQASRDAWKGPVARS